MHSSGSDCWKIAIKNTLSGHRAVHCLNTNEKAGTFLPVSVDPEDPSKANIMMGKVERDRQNRVEQNWGEEGMGWIWWRLCTLDPIQQPPHHLSLNLLSEEQLQRGNLRESKRILLKPPVLPLPFGYSKHLFSISRGRRIGLGY